MALSERDVELLWAYEKWIETVRGLSELEPPTANRHRLCYYSSDWRPTIFDVQKSRLFWWIRSGHEPLPYPPPTAFSCPWYEVISNAGDHSCFELGVSKFGDKIQVAANQCIYDVIEKKSEDELILGYGPYRFRAVRDEEKECRRLASINGKDDWTRFADSVKRRTRAWFIRRVTELENWPAGQCPSLS